MSVCMTHLKLICKFFKWYNHCAYLWGAVWHCDMCIYIVYSVMLWCVHNVTVIHVLVYAHMWCIHIVHSVTLCYMYWCTHMYSLMPWCCTWMCTYVVHTHCDLQYVYIYAHICSAVVCPVWCHDPRACMCTYMTHILYRAWPCGTCSCMCTYVIQCTVRLCTLYNDEIGEMSRFITSTFMFLCAKSVQNPL